MSTKMFPLNDVLTIATGRILTGLSETYEIASFIAGERLTSLWEVFCKEYKSYLLDKFPQFTTPNFAIALAKLDRTIKEVDKNNKEKQEEIWRVWLKEQTGIYGETLEVQSMY